MTESSAVEQAVQQRIAAARRRAEEEKKRRLAQLGLDLAPPTNPSNQTLSASGA
ncbi:hypothetical protein ABZX99_02965 [Streptomyces antibioticus]|uniref:hypothetical protein n=1 Tax=Streptomyces antibioticus TaxID=1890 RepID=UPI00195F3A74|nr:hypothetical protein [Streptomyces sp. S9]